MWLLGVFRYILSSCWHEQRFLETCCLRAHKPFHYHPAIYQSNTHVLWFALALYLPFNMECLLWEASSRRAHESALVFVFPNLGHFIVRWQCRDPCHLRLLMAKHMLLVGIFWVGANESCEKKKKNSFVGGKWLSISELKISGNQCIEANYLENEISRLKQRFTIDVMLKSLHPKTGSTKSIHAW